MSVGLKTLADEAKRAHDSAIQARRIAEFEYNTACEAFEAIELRVTKGREALDEAKRAERIAGEKADKAFFNLAKSTVSDSGIVRGGNNG